MDGKLIAEGRSGECTCCDGVRAYLVTRRHDDDADENDADEEDEDDEDMRFDTTTLATLCLNYMLQVSKANRNDA